MPSSPSFHDYSRGPNQRFFYRGVSLLPPDALGEGKVSYARNVRSYSEGEITVRDGRRRLTSAAMNGPANATFRLNDPALLAGGAESVRFHGTEAGSVYGYDPSVVPNAPANLDNGYGADPVAGVIGMPVASPQPWAYVYGLDRMRKINAALQVRSIGLPPPASPCVARLAANQTTFLQSIDSGTWVSYGPDAGAVAASATGRVNTVVNAVIYDEGATGICSVALADMTGITEGATVDLGGASETVIVQEIIPAISPTTIAAILYDVGASGLCTIQPTGSFALGQTESASPEEIRRRYHDVSDPQTSRPITITRTVDFPVNGLIMINAIELVRIQSVAIGADGVMSFRAFTAGTYAAGQSLTGAACFRAYTNTTIAGGDPARAATAQNDITPAAVDVASLGGIQTAIAGRDWSQTGSRAMQPDDVISLGINISALAYVQFVRLMLATNAGSVPAGEEFSQNYYQYEWRANDLLAAVQALVASATAAPTSPMLAAQQTAVVSGQAESLYQRGYGTELLPGGYVGDQLVVGGANNQPVEAGTGEVMSGPAPRTDGYVTAGTAPSRQLALGNSQWITLQCRVRDLLRVGTDPGRTLANLNSAAVVLQVFGTTSAVTVKYSDPYLTGGYGPDCGLTNPPYVWRYAYRSTITGERSNPSPSMRAGIPARRQRVSVTVKGCTEPQCDVIDLFRFGGTLARWTYDRSVPNDTTGADVTANLDNADRQIDGGESLRVDLFQPWPTSDLPRAGTCRVVGTSVERVSGDAFNTAWAPDTPIIVNGRATSLYGSPTSADRLTVIDNCDSGNPVDWSIPAPTLMAQPLGRAWGGYVDNVWFHFACGDPTDPGAVHWSHGNDPDSSSDANTLAITPAGEPLQHGFVGDGRAFVWSTDGLYRLDPAFGTAATFHPVKTACKRGLWNPWAFAVGPDGVYFVAQDGIFKTAWGGEEVSIVDPDLRRLFPRDGSNPELPADSCIGAIDWTAPMCLSFVDQMLYFDYTLTVGGGATLVYEPLYGRWTPDSYPSHVRSRIEEPGEFVHDNVTGHQDGHASRGDSTVLQDYGTAIQWLVSTPWATGDDPRALKQWGDVVVEADTADSCDGIKVEPVVDNGVVTLPPTYIGIQIDGRENYLAEVPSGGVLSRNFGLLISGIIQDSDLGRPRLFYWEPSWLHKQTPIARRVTDWEDLGYKGAKFVQGVVLRANTFGVLKNIGVQYDGGIQALQIPIVHSGERQIAYPRDENGWAPFTAELVRLIGLDDVEWTLLDWRWVWEPAPELATQWETQDTTFDFPGYGSVADAVLAYQSAVETTLRVYHDNSYVDYAIPSSGNIYRRHHVWFQAKKGLSYRFRWTGDQPFRVFQKDTSVRAQAWGVASGWSVLQPFGGPSRVVGAEV